MMQPYTYDPIALQQQRQQQQMRQNQQPTIDLDDLLGTRSNRSCPQQNPVTSTTGHCSQKAPPPPTTPPPPLLNLDPFGFSQLQAAPRAIPLPLATPATRPILTAGDEDAQRLRLLRGSGPICQAAHETRASAWRCTNCTYTSPKDRTKCDMCDCDREGVDPAPVVAECPPSSWKCGVCTLSNELKLDARPSPNFQIRILGYQRMTLSPFGRAEHALLTTRWMWHTVKLALAFALAPVSIVQRPWFGNRTTMPLAAPRAVFPSHCSFGNTIVEHAVRSSAPGTPRTKESCTRRM